MSEHCPPVVVGVDFSETGDLALAKALDIAARDCAELHVLAVVDDYSAYGQPWAPVYRDVMEKSALEARERLQTHVARTVDAFMKARPGAKMGQVIVHVRVGLPADQIVRLARDVEADLVVVGTHGRRGVQRFLIGSVAERVLRLAERPVLVVRPKGGDAAAEVPEPACAECVARRKATKGGEWWCVEHSKPHEQPHFVRYTEVFRHPNPIYFGADA